MSTKQLRLSDSGQIHNRLNEFRGKKINIVLHDGNVFLGVLTAFTETEITITNMRLKEMSFALTRINELYFDTEA